MLSIEARGREGEREGGLSQGGWGGGEGPGVCGKGGGVPLGTRLLHTVFFFVLGNYFSANITGNFTAQYQGKPKGRQQKGETGPRTHIFADFCRFSLIFGSLCKSRDLGVADLRRKPQETADFRRKPQKTADFCRNRCLPFAVSLLARSYNIPRGISECNVRIGAALLWKPRIFRLQLQFCSRCCVGVNYCNVTPLNSLQDFCTLLDRNCLQ